MKSARITTLATTFMLSAAVFAATDGGASKKETAAAPNQPAPAFSLPDLSGETVTLPGETGKYVVLEWTNYDCPFVKKHYETGRMSALQKKMKQDGVLWYSICSSAPGKQGHFTPEQWSGRMKAVDAAPAAVLLDADGIVGKKYGAKNTPYMVVIDPGGVVRYMGAIDDQRGLDRSIMDKAVNYVTQAIESLKAEDPIARPVMPAYGCSVKY